MGHRLSQDERRAVAQRIFAALCAHYPDRQIALFERAHADIGSSEGVVANPAVAATTQRTHDGADKNP
jgi:hypothetical protein